jgi:hypothetical protein
MPAKSKWSSRRNVFSVLAVELPPMPTNTGTRPVTTPSVRSINASLSSSSSVGLSPVVPSGKIPLIPAAM